MPFLFYKLRLQFIQHKIMFLSFLAIIFICYYNALFYPGYLTSESIFILNQATGSIPSNNWRSVLLTKIWVGLYTLFKSAGGLWSLQIFLYFGSLVFFTTHLHSVLLSVLCLSAMALYPPLTTNLAALSEDSWAISFALLSLATFFRFVKDRSSSNEKIFLSLCILTILIQYSYFMVMLPLLIAAGLADNEKYPNARIKKAVWMIFLAASLSFVIGKTLDFMVKQEYSPWAAFAIWDIAGIRNFSAPGSAIADYNCISASPVIYANDKIVDIALPHQDNHTPLNIGRKNTLSLWFKSLKGDPSAYLTHRLCVAKYFFGYQTHHVVVPYPEPIYNNFPLSQIGSRSQLNVYNYRLYDAYADSFMYRYWYYLGLIFIIMAASLAINKLTLMDTAIAGTVIGAAARVLVLADSDFSHGLWIVVGTLVFLSIKADNVVSHFSRPDDRRV